MDIQVSCKTKMKIYDYKYDTFIEQDVPKSKRFSQVLTEAEILTLSKYGIILEKHYEDNPQDIEFGIDENNKIVILQNRYIIT